MRRSYGVVLAAAMLFVCGICDAKPAKEVPRKGKPADQEVLNARCDYMDASLAKADGNLSEWGEAKEVSFKTLLAGEYEYDWTGPVDLSATLKVMYSDEAFHVLVQVNDNAIVNKLRDWKSDKVEVWLMATDGNGKPAGKLTGIQFDMGPAVSGGKMVTKVLAGDKNMSKIRAEGYVGDGAYDVELAVDYSLLAKNNPAYDGGIRYCVLVRDWDQDDPNEDEAVIGSCPIDPKNPSKIKPENMGFARLDLNRIQWQSILANDPVLGAKQGEWLIYHKDFQGSPATETFAYLDGEVVLAGYGLGGANGLSWSAISLTGTGTDPKIEFVNLNSSKYDEIVITRTEACSEGGEGRRAYVFDVDNTGNLRLLLNYLVSVKSQDGREFSNKYQYTKKGIIQSLGSGAEIPCNPDYSDDMVPLLVPDGPKKRTLVL